MNYDSSGLMAQIQALIAAPNSTRTRTNNKHPYFKRPGRGHNHDTCDACHEAGDLLCCDTCSASFHLVCVNPPLAYEQIPSGDWRCHRCLCSQSDGNEESIQKKHAANHRRGKKRSAVSAAGREPCAKKPALTANTETPINGREGGVLLKFFDQAVEMAKKMNPEQFTLPKYLMEYGAAQFPGSARPVPKKGNAKANKQIIETENGMVPSPILLCFVCEISCRKGPMIKCDGCSAFFHFECVNPPLTGVPQGRWLCHLHPEPTLENKSLKSLSFTERVRLYDYAKQPIDPIQVALRFVTKTQRAKHSYFRSKAPIKGKDYTQVPGPIVKCYTEEEHDENLPAWPTFEEVTEKRTQEFHEKIINAKQDFGEASDDMNPLELLAQIASKELDEKSKNQSVPAKDTSNSGPIGHTTVPQKYIETKDARVAINYDKTFECIKKEKLSVQDENLLEGLDLDAILQLAAQKMRELHCNETMDCANGFGENSRSDGSSSSHVHPQNELKEAQKNFNIGVDFREACENTVSNTQNSNPAVTQVEIPVPYIKFLILNANKEVLFKEGQVMIGRGTAELNVHDYFACQSVTDEHCCVYFDYVRGRWELINYSPNGTIVNKVPYGCDRKTQAKSKLAPDLKFVKEGKRKSNGIQQLSSNQNQSQETSSRCSCNNNRSFEESMDGSAYLDVGSRIQIGCVRIVVIDTGSESKWVSREHLLYNSITKLPLYKKNVDSQDVSCDDSKKNTSESDSETETVDDVDASDSEQLVNGNAKEPTRKPSPNVKPRRVNARPATTRGRGRGRGRGRAAGTIGRRKQSNEENVTKDTTVRRKATRGRRRKSDCVNSSNVVVKKASQKGDKSPNVGLDPDIVIKQEIVSNSNIPEPTHLMGSPIEDHDYVAAANNQSSHVNRRDLDKLPNVMAKATNIR